MPVGAAVVPRGAALGRRDLPHAEEGAPRPRACPPPSATRAASPRTWPATRTPSRSSSRRSSRPATRPATDIAIALDPATSELYRDGAYHLTGEGKVLSQRRLRRLLGPPRRHLPDRVDRGRHGRGRLGRLEGAHRRRRRPGAARRRRPVRHQRPAGSQMGIERGRRQQRAVKVNQIGTLTETLDTVELADPARLHQRDEPPLGRDRGRDHRRPRRRHELRPDQDRRARPASDRVAKYNQLLRIEAELGESAAYRGRGAARAEVTR